jgi:hypothetical protein
MSAAIKFYDVNGVLYLPAELERVKRLLRAGKRPLAQTIMRRVLGAQAERKEALYANRNRGPRRPAGGAG